MYKEETNQQIGFARVITYLATFAYLADVFVLPSYRGLGLSKWLMETITNVSELKGVRRFLLGTLDVYGLYEQYGFKRIAEPQRFMEISRKNMYMKKIEVQ